MRWLWMMSLLSCATLAENSGGGVNLPNANAGPFREITAEELGESRRAPYALRDEEMRYRDVTTVDADGAPETPQAWLYAAANLPPGEGEEPDPDAPASRVVRFVASDGRSPSRFGDEVLVAEPAPSWEAGMVATPSALWVEDELWLYYAGAGGIGLATSRDGLSFERVGDAPSLGVAESGWDAGAIPRSPHVLAVGGGFQLFYEVRAQGRRSIGEAHSEDGRSWVRGASPVLTAPEELGEGAGVGAPQVVAATTSLGRAVQYLYHAVDQGEGSVIGLAARYGASGPFSRSASPVFGASGELSPSEPWVVRHEHFSLLFVTQKAGDSEAQDYPAVAIGVAPAGVSLP